MRLSNLVLIAEDLVLSQIVTNSVQSVRMVLEGQGQRVVEANILVTYKAGREMGYWNSYWTVTKWKDEIGWKPRIPDDFVKEVLESLREGQSWLDEGGDSHSSSQHKRVVGLPILQCQGFTL